MLVLIVILDNLLIVSGLDGLGRRFLPGFPQSVVDY